MKSLLPGRRPTGVEDLVSSARPVSFPRWRGLGSESTEIVVVIIDQIVIVLIQNNAVLLILPQLRVKFLELLLLLELLEATVVRLRRVTEGRHLTHPSRATVSAPSSVRVMMIATATTAQIGTSVHDTEGRSLGSGSGSFAVRPRVMMGLERVLLLRVCVEGVRGSIVPSLVHRMLRIRAVARVLRSGVRSCGSSGSSGRRERASCTVEDVLCLLLLLLLLW